ALQAKRPAGTAMLPLVYATAFEQGMFPGSLVEDSPLDNRAVMIGGMTGILGEWGPESADNRYEGTISARQALVKSKNGATVRIGMEAGLDEVLQLCRTAGIRSSLRPYPATLLGSSNFTCAVWAGFDKPQKIYRGAFGRELALPVWVDIMNTAAARYSPREIKRPPGLKEVEICLRSGMLATDKCYDTVRIATGDSVQ